MKRFTEKADSFSEVVALERRKKACVSAEWMKGRRDGWLAVMGPSGILASRAKLMYMDSNDLSMVVRVRREVIHVYDVSVENSRDDSACVIGRTSSGTALYSDTAAGLTDAIEKIWKNIGSWLKYMETHEDADEEGKEVNDGE